MEVGGLFAVPTWHLFIRRNPGFILFIMPLWGPSVRPPVAHYPNTLEYPHHHHAPNPGFSFSFCWLHLALLGLVGYTRGVNAWV